MSANTNAPIIIKRKKVIQGGHHGGAWKVAYADFVTAMMAFFLLMWLLGATNEKQRKGIADYFNPTIPINKVSGGGDGAFGGDSVFTEATLADQGTGAAVMLAGDAKDDAAPGDPEDEMTEAQALQAVAAALNGRGGESFVSDILSRHIVTRLSDEGLVVELFETDGARLFDGDQGATPLLNSLLSAVGEAFRLVSNDIAIEAHVASGTPGPWVVSAGRADVVRARLTSIGLPPERIERLTGFGAGQPVMRNEAAPRNNRVEIILLRHQL